MKRLLLSHSNICVGCRICENICALNKEKNSNPKLSRIRVIKSEKSGIDVPTFCRQCPDPPCANACKNNAIIKDPINNLVIINENKCVGCGNCISACPVGVLIFHPKRGIVVKCDLCGGSPKCVEWCPNNVIIYINSTRDVLNSNLRRKLN